MLKPVEDRLTIIQAQKHLWLQSSKKKRSRRNSSFDIKVHEQFHHEFKTIMINANAKEEGNQASSKKLFKSIKLLRNNTFELEDSDDEDSMVTPRRNTRQPCSAQPIFSFGSCTDSHVNNKQLC